MHKINVKIHLYEVIQRTFSQMIKEQIQLDIDG